MHLGEGMEFTGDKSAVHRLKEPEGPDLSWLCLCLDLMMRKHYPLVEDYSVDGPDDPVHILFNVLGIHVR